MVYASSKKTYHVRKIPIVLPLATAQYGMLCVVGQRYSRYRKVGGLCGGIAFPTT